ncbi:MAG: capsular biosynthesis protein, partial [Nonlabens sp.]|nr:capsular biosynthesis protein [Nonlabens sp.]
MWIFSKKYFLRDLLPGVVDIHNHILPGIDDGAPNIEVTKTMLSLYTDLGITNCIATPHTMADYYGNTLSGIQDVFVQTKKELLGSAHENTICSVASEY